MVVTSSKNCEAAEIILENSLIPDWIEDSMLAQDKRKLWPSLSPVTQCYTLKPWSMMWFLHKSTLRGGTDPIFHKESSILLVSLCLLLSLSFAGNLLACPLGDPGRVPLLLYS